MGLVLESGNGNGDDKVGLFLGAVFQMTLKLCSTRKEALSSRKEVCLCLCSLFSFFVYVCICCSVYSVDVKQWEALGSFGPQDVHHQVRVM